MRGRTDRQPAPQRRVATWAHEKAPTQISPSQPPRPESPRSVLLDTWCETERTRVTCDTQVGVTAIASSFTAFVPENGGGLSEMKRHVILAITPKSSTPRSSSARFRLGIA